MFTFQNFTGPVGLAIPKIYPTDPNFTSLGCWACAIFQRLVMAKTQIMAMRAG